MGKGQRSSSRAWKWFDSGGNRMTQIALTITILFGVYFFDYFVGRKQILDEIKALSQELEEKEHDAIKM
jgi:hypothetical protein